LSAFAGNKIYCDCSAYYQKAIKATPRQSYQFSVGVAFFAFWAITLLDENSQIDHTKFYM